MKTTTYTLLLLAGLACFGAMPPASPEPGQTGKVLLLDTEQILEGNIEKIGDIYRIKGKTGEIILPISRTMALVQSRKEALDFLRQNANLRDPDEHLKLARWCILQDLKDEALVEAREVLRADPQNTDAQVIVIGLQQSDQRSKTQLQAVPPKVAKTQPVVEVSPTEFNRESFGLFVTKVQPILMNTCIGCHSGGKGGGFQLIHAKMAGDRKAYLNNLAVTLKFVDRAHPGKSPFLRNAVTAHGDALVAPLKDQKLLAYEHLEVWVSLALAPDGSTDGVSLVEDEKMVERKWEPKESTPSVVAGPKKQGPVFGEDSNSKPLPEVKTAPSDPFDPAIFNGEIKPKN
jgi:hypothetical protein